jgi:5'-3' exonuclease
VGVFAKFGVTPESIPDFLALVGDSADGFPGVAGWGRKSAAAALARYRHLEEIPQDWRQWDIPIRGAQSLSTSLLNQWNDALLFRTLATLRTDVPVFESIEDLRWKGPTANFGDMCGRLGAQDLLARAEKCGRPIPS